MGYHIHHAIVVTSWQTKGINEAHRLALRHFGVSSIVSPLRGGLTNGYESFFVAPDGSKEGWPESDDMDIKRTEFKAALRELARRDLWVSWVEVAFGGDEPEINTRVVDHNAALHQAVIE